jgi:hypothetical protein
MVPIKGKLDKIEFTGNDVNVADYKTGKPNTEAKTTDPATLGFWIILNRDEVLGNTEVNIGVNWSSIKILMDHQRFKSGTGEGELILSRRMRRRI